MRKVILAVALLCLPIIAAAVTSPMPYVKIQFLDNSGAPCAGCSLYSYSAGTSTPLATYTDSSGLSQNTNPIVLDSAGRANIWLGSNSYKFVLKDANGITLWTVDNVTNYTILSQNNVWTGNNTFTGTTNFTGPVTISGSTMTVCSLNTNLLVGPASCYSTIAAAYAAGASTGVTVVLGSDITISSAQTVTLTTGKPLWVNLNGHKISCTQSSGSCLTFAKPDATPRYSLTISNGTVTYSGASASVTGITLGLGSGVQANTNCRVSGLTINNFSTSGSVGLALSDAEDCIVENTLLNGNTIAAAVNKDSNNTKFNSVWIQGGTTGIVITDASGFVCDTCLIQSSTGIHAAEINSVTQNVYNTEFRNTWFENNGDTTLNSRQIYLSAAAAKSVNFTIFKGNTYNGATNGVNGYIYEFSGTGSLVSVTMSNNRNNIPLKQTGFPNGTQLFQDGESVVACSVCINVSGISNLIDSGLHFATKGAGTNFSIYQGYSGLNDNTLNFRDDSTNADILTFDHTNARWVAYKSLAFFNGNVVAGYSDAGTTLQWTISNGTGNATFNALTTTGIKAQTAGSGSVGDATLPFQSVIVGSATNVYSALTTTATTNRSAVLPDASGNLVIKEAANVSHAVCWKTNDTLGYCSDTVGAGGTCTCN